MERVLRASKEQLTLNGKTMSVRANKSKHERSELNEQANSKKVFAILASPHGCPHPLPRQRDLVSAFSQFGEVKDVNFNKKLGSCCYAIFQDQEAARACISASPLRVPNSELKLFVTPFVAVERGANPHISQPSFKAMRDSLVGLTRQHPDSLSPFLRNSSEEERRNIDVDIDRRGLENEQSWPVQSRLRGHGQDREAFDAGLTSREVIRDLGPYHQDLDQIRFNRASSVLSEQDQHEDSKARIQPSKSSSSNRSKSI
jgi:hypothetical protein